MGDMGEVFRLMRASAKERKAARLDEAQPLLDHMQKHTQWHYSTLLQADILDYWPTTNKWRWRNKNYHGTVDDLIHFIGKRI